MRLLPCALLVVLLLACSGEDPAPTQTATSPATSTPRAEASPTPRPAGTPEPVTRVPLTIQLADIEAGETLTLVETFEQYPPSAVFNAAGDRVHVLTFHNSLGSMTAFELDGSPVPPGEVQPDCTADRSLIPADSFESFACADVVKPGLGTDGAWALSRIEQQAPEYDLWAENDQTGERFLVAAGLLDCGGCDARFGAILSPSHRYLVYGETGQQLGGRVYLIDFETRTSRPLGLGVEVGDAPQWSPRGDILLWPTETDSITIDDLTASTSREFPDLQWPARFDGSGEFFYSYTPPYDGSGRYETTLVEVATGAVLYTISGVPDPLNVWRDLRTVVSGPGGITAALEQADGCGGGTAIYRNDEPVPFGCVLKGTGATVSPDGTKVAVAAVSGMTGQVEYPGGSAVSLPVYDIVIFDLATMGQRVIVSGAVGDQPPDLTWNNASSHLLIRWPVHSGL